MSTLFNQNTTGFNHVGTSTGGGSPTGGGTNSGTLSILEDENITPEVRDFLFEDIMEGMNVLLFLIFSQNFL